MKTWKNERMRLANCHVARRYESIIEGDSVKERYRVVASSVLMSVGCDSPQLLCTRVCAG